MIRVLLVIIAVSFLAASASAQADGSREVLAAAERAFDEAVLAAPDDPDRARALYEEAAGGYESLVMTHNVRTPAAYRALGSSRLLAGDVGRAVLNLRRADALDPRDPRTRAGLEHARTLVRTRVTPSVGDRALNAVLWWRGFVPRWALFGAFAVAFAGVWVVGATRLVMPTRLRGPWCVTLGAIAALCLGSLIVEEIALERSRPVVVIAESIARTGPSEAVYEPAFENAVSPGVEASARERRDGWVRVRLADAREAWLPDRALAWVYPASDSLE